MTSIITKPSVEIKKELLEELQTLVQEESQVIIHCIFDGTNTSDCLIRIWPTTFLYDTGSSHRSELVHAEHITLYPTWTLVPDGATMHFSLIFTGLPKSCSAFDFIEEIPEDGGFRAFGINRNASDVYYIKV